MRAEERAQGGEAAAAGETAWSAMSEQQPGGE